MKKILMLFCAGVLISALGAGCEKNELPKLSDGYYWSDGVKYPLKRLDNKYYLIFPAEKTDIVVEKLRTNGATVDILHIYEYTKSFVDGNTPAELSGCNFIEKVETTSPISLNHIPELVYLAPYYMIEGVDIGITNIFSVRAEESELEKLAKKYKFIVLGQSEYDQSIIYLACTKNTMGNAVEMANLMYEKGVSKYATPEFIMGAITD